jgi:alpha-mannosidase
MTKGQLPLSFGSIPLIFLAVVFTPRTGLSKLTLVDSTQEHVANPLWQIGEFDQGSAEFRDNGIDYSDPKQDPIFRVGVSRNQDWPRFQPGPANGMTGGRPHPFTILFPVKDTPQGVYHLKIAILYETPRLSSLRVDLNGHTGRFYFHPHLTYGSDDWEETFVPQTSAATKVIDLQAAWFKHGENRLVLTALDDPSDVENSLGSIAPGHTGIVYDAIALTQDPAATYELHRVSVSVEPTIFFRNSNSGTSELVEAILDFASMPPKGVVELLLNGKSNRQEFHTEESFGERRVEFSLAEWTGTLPATATVYGEGEPRTFFVQLTSAKKWTLFIIPHEHLDIGFTDYPAAVAELHSQSIDDAMEIQKRIPDFHWTLDGFWPVEQYMAGRSKEKQQELVNHLRDGKILLPLEYSNQHTGTASLEGLARSLYGSHFFAKDHDFKIGWAQDVDVPSYSWSYASILHDAGIKYFLGASNNWRAPVLLHGRLNEESPFYWEGPDGGRVLMWYSRAYLQMQTLFGSPARVAAVRDALPVFLEAYSRSDYKSNAAIIFGSQLENTSLSKEQAEFPGKWNAEYAWPKLQFASVPEAMSSIERDFGGNIQVYRGDLGSFWEDGFGSDSAYTAMHRANQRRIATAEAIGVVPTLLDSALRPDEGLLQAAWRNQILFDEHTWTFAGATTQPESAQTVTQTWLRQSRALEARREVAESTERSWAQFAPFLARAASSVAVFNPLSWKRSGFVEFDLADNTEIVDPVSGKTVSVDVISIGRGTALPGFGNGYCKVRFVAEEVPPLGVKVYELRPGKTAGKSLPTQNSGEVVENQFYRLTLDPGSASVQSIYDKELARELVDEASPYRLGEYLYVSGADDMPHNSLYRYKAGSLPQLEVHTPFGGRIESIREVPEGTKITMTSSSVNTPAIRVEILLARNEKKILISYSLTKTKVLTKESVYFAFPFRSQNPSFGYSLQSAWVDPAKDQLPGANKEWFAVTDWAAVHDSQFAAAVVPLDTPLVSFGDIARGKWPTDFTPGNGTIFSWVMNNYWGTNFVPWQGGEFQFRYVVTSRRNFDPEELTRFGREEMTPLEVSSVAGTIFQQKPPKSEVSFLSIDNSSLTEVTWKMAEDGDGTILRLQNISSHSGSASVHSDVFRFTSATKCDLLEECAVPIPVNDEGFQISFAPYEILTIRLKSNASREWSVARLAAH